MHRFLTTTAAAALLTLGLASGVFASGYEDTIRSAYEAAGYTQIDVRNANGQWLVTASKDGAEYHFIVDQTTGQSTQVMDDSAEAGLFDDDGSNDSADDSTDDAGQGDDGAGHDAGDDNGTDGAGHDAGDDSGSDDKGSDDKGGGSDD